MKLGSSPPSHLASSPMPETTVHVRFGRSTTSQNVGNVPEPLSVSDRIRYRPAISAASYCGRGGSALRALGDGESGNTGRIVNVPAYTGSTPRGVGSLKSPLVHSPVFWR